MAEEAKPKATVKSVNLKPEEAKAAAPAKKPAAKKTAAPKTEVSVQFDGKTYTTETLIQSAKDVWKYDLKKDPADLKSIQLYVKTEESRVYYVMDGELGSFEI